MTKLVSLRRGVCSLVILYQAARTYRLYTEHRQSRACVYSYGLMYSSYDHGYELLVRGMLRGRLATIAYVLRAQTYKTQVTPLGEHTVLYVFERCCCPMWRVIRCVLYVYMRTQRCMTG